MTENDRHGGAVGQHDEEETFECISIVEYNENAPDYRADAKPGDRVILSGVQRNTHVRDDEKEGFVKIGEAVAIIELFQPLTDDEVTEWCNTPVGKLTLSHWFDHVDPDDVVMT